MPLPDHIELLCLAIRKKAESQAEKIIQEAQKRADRMIAKGLQDLDRQIEAKKLSLKRQAFQESRRKTDSAELEARRLVMAAKEDIFKQALEKAQKILLDIKKQKNTYKDILKEMIRSACAILGVSDGSSFIVQCSKEDAPLVEQAAREVEQDIHCKIATEINSEIDGGIVVMSQDKSRMVDMTFGALLKRLDPQIRRLVAQKIFVGERR